MMHHYGYSIKRGVLPFIRGTWYRLSTAIRCNIENGYAALTLLTMKTWRHLTVEKQIKQHADTWLKEKYGMLTFDDYQTSAKGTAIYPKQYRLMYPALGLAGEAGEVANKIKKIVRDGEGRRTIRCKVAVITGKIYLDSAVPTATPRKKCGSFGSCCCASVTVLP